MYLSFRGPGNRPHGEPLACIVREAAKENNGDLRAFSPDHVQDIFFPEPEFTFSRCDLDDGILGVKTVVPNLGSESILRRLREYPLACTYFVRCPERSAHLI